MIRRRVLVAGAYAFALAGCAGSGGSKGASPSTATTAPVDAAVATDQRIANAARIRAEDLPGWEVTPRKPSASSEIKRVAAGIPACGQFVAGIRDGRARARSAKFAQNGTTVDGDVDVYATSAEVQAQLELYRDPAIIGCLQALFTKPLSASAPAGATVGTVSVSPIAVDECGDGGYGFRVTANVTRDGQPHTILSDLVGVAVGRVGASLTVSSADAANLAQTEATLLPLVTQRIRDAEH